MRTANGRATRVWIIALISTWVSGMGPAAPARASCMSYEDLPSCTCYTGSVAWALPEVAGDVLATGETQVGAETSCLRHRGQPYWQIQLQLDSPVWPEFLALFYPWYDVVSAYPEEAWCSETVSFWHRQASVPYSKGYYSSIWYPSSYVKNVSDLVTWYMAEEELAAFSLPGTSYRLGRGRWVDAVDLDYSDFQPGVNAPCPGAYQALQAYEPGSETWPSTGCTHSQVVDSVIIHRSGSLAGPIESVDLLMLEGNAGSNSFVDVDGSTVSQGSVQRSVRYTDVFRYTPAGSDRIGTCSSTSSTAVWKIRGWGIDRGPTGTPLYDASRIREDVVATMAHTTAARIVPTATPPPDPDTTLAGAIRDYVLSRGGPITVATNTQALVATDLPTPEEPWILPPAPFGVDTAWVEVDLRANHPLPMRGTVVEWKDGRIPQDYQVRWAPEGGPFHVAPMHLPPVPQGPAGSLPIVTQDTLRRVTRRVRFVFPATALTQEFRITGVHLLLNRPGQEDEGDVFGPPTLTAVGTPVPDRRLSLRAEPNPFRDQARISLKGVPDVFDVEVCDVAGRRVRTLGRVSTSAGPTTVVWDGRDERGRAAPSGVYIIRARGRVSEASIELVRLQ